MRSSDVGELAGRVRDVLLTQSSNLAAAYLFGSRARGDARTGSDVDLGVLYRDEPAPVFYSEVSRLQVLLETRLRTRVDLLVLNRAPVDLVHRVLRDGVLILDRDKRLRVRFEVRSRAKYLDILPILRRYRRGRGEVA